MKPLRRTATHAAAVLLFSLAALPALPAHATGSAPSEADALRVLRQQEKQRQDLYRAWFPDAATARKAAISYHHALLESNYEAGWLLLELEPEELARLQAEGFRVEIALDAIARRNARLDRFQQWADADVARGGSGVPTGHSIPGYSCYETVEETFAVAQGFATAHPTLASWIDAGDSWQKATGAGGYDMGVLKLTNSAIPGPKPKLFITSAIHAREYTTAPIALEFARWLVNGYGVDPDATWIMDHQETHLMLQSNPDGRKKAESGLLWRKNTDTAYCGATSNNRGADLNRNFTFSWNSTNGQGSSGNPCNETYRGASAHSEPEVQAIEAYIASIFADQRGPARSDAAPADTMGVHLDLHSYSQLVLWPWGDTSGAAPNGAAMTTMGRRLAYFNGYTPEQSIGLYPTDGTSDGPSYGERGIPAFTIELGSSFFESCTTYEGTTKPKNLPALVYAARVARAPYLLPSGPDVTSVAVADGGGVAAGTPVALTASVTDTRFNNSNGTEPTQAIAAAEAYVDTPPWATGATAIPLSASDGAFDSKTEAIGGTLATSGLSTGQHLVFVRGRDASGAWGPVSAAFLHVGSAGGATEHEPNDTLATANAVAAPSTLTGTMGASTDNDWFSVSLPAGATLTATLAPNATSNYNLFVYDASGTLLASGKKGTGLVDTVSVANTGASAVQRYVKVKYASGATGSGGIYSLGLAW